MLWDPLHFLEVCRPSDGAAAVVLGSEGRSDVGGEPPAWVVAPRQRHRSASSFPGRRPGPHAGRLDCSAALYEKGGPQDSTRQIDLREIVRAFAWYEPSVAGRPRHHEKGQRGGAHRAGRDGRSAARSPSKPRGGVLSSNRSARRA